MVRITREPKTYISYEIANNEVHVKTTKISLFDQIVRAIFGRSRNTDLTKFPKLTENRKITIETSDSQAVESMLEGSKIPERVKSILNGVLHPPKPAPATPPAQQPVQQPVQQPKTSPKQKEVAVQPSADVPAGPAKGHNSKRKNAKKLVDKAADFVMPWREDQRKAKEHMNAAKSGLNKTGDALDQASQETKEAKGHLGKIRHRIQGKKKR